MGKAGDRKKAQAAADAAAAAKAALVAVSSEGELTPPARLLYPYDAYERLHAYDQLTDPPCGLTNCGNSCFGAAALNCLAFTRPMVAYCVRKPGQQPPGAPDHNEGTCGEPGWCFLCQLQRHVKKAMGRKTAFAPVDIVSKVRELGNHLSFGAEVRTDVSFSPPCLSFVGGGGCVCTLRAAPLLRYTRRSSPSPYRSQRAAAAPHSRRRRPAGVG